MHLTDDNRESGVGISVLELNSWVRRFLVLVFVAASGTGMITDSFAAIRTFGQTDTLQQLSIVPTCWARRSLIRQRTRLRTLAMSWSMAIYPSFSSKTSVKRIRRFAISHVGQVIFFA